MSISSASSPFRKRASALSFESSKFSLERSRSCTEPISRNKIRKSLTFGQVLSSEGLDLGLPGVYRAKSDDAQNVTVDIDLCSGRAQKKTLHLDELKESLPRIEFSSVLHPYEEIFPNVTQEAVPSVKAPGMTGCSLQPPPKPPRVKSRRTGTSLCTVLNNSLTVTAQVKDLPASSLTVSYIPNFNSGMMKIEEVCEHPSSARNMQMKYEKKHSEDLDDVFLENEKKIKAEKHPPIYATVKKFRMKSKEKLRHIRSDDSTLSPRKPDIFSRTFSDAGNYTSHQQLKASLSGPFDFRKVSSGEMLQTTPIDLLQSHVPSQLRETRRTHQAGPELPPRNFVKDDACLSQFQGMQGPDILSHINISKTKTLSCNPSELKKYETVWNRSRKSSNSKKASWFFRRLSHRKHSNNDLQTECLLNQVEPLDHGLLSRKDSHGSTEDETMENHQSNLDVKDKKKKKKDKKGKPPSRHGSDAKQSDKVRNKLRKFISKRPTMESLQERGLILETVFCCPLAKLCEKDGSAVPKFVKLCVEEVEERGLNIDGIYRMSGSLVQVNELKYRIDRDIPVNLKDKEWEDIHVITGALKMFLRELPEPVIPFQFFDKFIASCKISDENSKFDATKSLIRALPKPNRETLKYLMRHLCSVASKLGANRMDVQNVAIVFGPTLLLKPPMSTSHNDPGGGNMAVFMIYQNTIVEYMLTHYETLFS